MARYQYRSIEQAQKAGEQTAARVMYGIRGSKYYPNYTASLGMLVEAAKTSRARVAHDPILVAYWDAQIVILEQRLKEVGA